VRSGDAKAAGQAVKDAERALARASQKGVVTKQSSARVTSRLAAAAAALAKR
jgi:ribosomal protein S20